MGATQDHSSGAGVSGPRNKLRNGSCGQIEAFPASSLPQREPGADGLGCRGQGQKELNLLPLPSSAGGS